MVIGLRSVDGDAGDGVAVDLLDRAGEVAKGAAPPVVVEPVVPALVVALVCLWGVLVLDEGRGVRQDVGEPLTDDDLPGVRLLLTLGREVGCEAQGIDLAAV